MKEENTKKAPQIEWINVHDDVLMIELGIRPPHATSRDPSVWGRKLFTDRKQLRTLRCIHKGKMQAASINHKTTPVYDKLIVYLKKNNKFPNTTYSIVCGLHQIGDILSYFCQKDKQTNTVFNIVSKYVYNGKTYSPNERPFWE